ncbi:hypothetical protein Q9233_014418 [Columba guinea]|nr:hypothetical protein Q9233_014418 [Columba guinea]
MDSEKWDQGRMGPTLAHKPFLRTLPKSDSYASQGPPAHWQQMFHCQGPKARLTRHPVVRKWPRSYEWFFMKMNIEHIWLQSWYGEVSAIAVEEYLKAVPSKG